MNHRDKRNILDELRHWQGVEDYRFETGGKHRKFIVKTKAGSRFITLSISASDGRAAQNQIKDLRKMLTELGATQEQGK